MTDDPTTSRVAASHPAGRIGRLHRTVGLKPPEFSRADLMAMSHLDPEVTVRWWRAMGFPEAADGDRIFGSDDAEIAIRLHALEEAGLLDDDAVLRLARVMGASFSRIADAQVSAIDDILSAVDGVAHAEGRRERLAAFVAGSDENLLDLVESTMLHVWRRHMLAAFARWLTFDDDLADAAVGFADISGFTKLSRDLEPRALAEMIDHFESTSHDIVTGFGGRVVKLIGDEVMFTCARLDTAVDIALALVEGADRDDLPPLSAGVAFGPSVTVGGDVFGPTVNLASRLTGIARPSTVALVRDDAEILDERDDLVVRRIRRSYDLKGIGRTRIVVVSHADPPDDDAEPDDTSEETEGDA